MFKRLAVLLTGFVIVTAAGAEKPRLASFVGPGGPWGIWKKSYNRRFPVEIIFKDLADIGLTDIYFPDQNGRGGPFLHPTKIAPAKVAWQMGERDHLKEVLEESAKYGMRVWLMWTTPGKEYPDSEIHGLNDPRMIKLYCDLIDEVAANYGHYENLEGIYWHELDCTEAPDNHADDVAEFADFCERAFGERFTGESMPKADPENVWWRRHFLYRIEVMNNFVRETRKAADRHGLKTSFCTYTAEVYSGEGWRWGYDTVDLEKLCDMQWFSGYSIESKKPYQDIKGAFIDFGPSYRGQILSRNFSYGMHGKALSYFSYRAPVYLEEMRKYYSSHESFTKIYGDFYTGFMGMTQQEVDLFFGKANFSKWVDLMLAWQGGSSPARVAVAVNVTPFVMQHPVATGVHYKRCVNDFMVDATRFTDLDGILLGSEFTLSPEKLRRYDLIIIPQDMGTGLTAETAASLRGYVAAGGKLLIIATPLTVTRRDLTEPVDLTAELCGIRFEAAGLPGYIKLASSVLPVPEKKRWSEALPQITVADAEVLVSEAFSGRPLLTRRGGVAFSALGYSADLASYFREIILRLTKPPAVLEGSTSIRILESVRKGNAACFALWETGKGTLRVDPGALGLTGEQFEVKELVTGARLAMGAAEVLAAGIPVEIRHPNQPFIVAVGAPSELEPFSGLYASADVFAGLTERRTVENPEVVIQVPEGPGLKVGVYHGAFASTTLLETIGNEPGLNAFTLPRLDEGALSKSDVVVISKCAATVYFKAAADMLRKWVENGGRLLLCFDAVGYRGHPPVVPELGKGFRNPKIDVLTVAAEHPVTAGLDRGATFVHGYADHVQMTAGAEGTVLVVDAEGKPAVIVGSVGQGRVVLNGMIPGYRSVKRGDYAGREQVPEGGELQILINAVKWLGEKTQ